MLDELIALGVLTNGEALEAAHQILHGNAEKLYLPAWAADFFSAFSHGC